MGYGAGSRAETEKGEEMTDAHKALNFLASSPGSSTTVTAEDARHILLKISATVIARGRLFNIHAELLGAEVYRLSLRLANP